MDRNVAAALVLAGVGVLGVAGITVATNGSEGSGTTAVVAQSSSVPEEHSHGTGQGLGQGQGSGNAQGIANGRGRGQGTGQGNGNGNGQRQGQGQNGSGAHGQGTQQESHASDIPAAVPGATISTKVRKELVYMVEEEKLARDIYALAKATYPDARIFANINRSESTHMSEVQVLLERYDVDDPTDGNRAGVFEDDSLQKLYNSLAVRVRASRAAAIQVGIDVEVTDIADLKKAMKLKAPSDVKSVLGSLLAGSERHLAAFQRNGGTIARA
jgi:hypothetical protein